jgi:hypothetical protein
MHARFIARRPTPLLLLAAALVLGLLATGGCDSTEDETTTLAPVTKTFRFDEFDVSQASATLPSDNTASITISDLGNTFQPSEIVSAHVSEVVLEEAISEANCLSQPSARAKVYGFLSLAEVTLLPSNGQPLLIASESDLGMGERVNLSLEGGTSDRVTSILRSGTSFQAELFLSLAGTNAGDCRVDVNVTFDIDAEGV